MIDRDGNPIPLDLGKVGLYTRARHVDMVAIAGVLYFFLVWSVCGEDFRFFLFFVLVYFQRKRPTTWTRQPCLVYLSICSVDFEAGAKASKCHPS